MKNLLRLIAVSALALHLGACSDTLAKFQSGIDAVEAAASSKAVGVVAPRIAIAAMSTYDAGVIVATKYQSLPRCTGANGPLCRDPAYRQKIDAAVYSGRVARNNLKAFMRANPDGTSVPSTLYDAVVTASNTIDQATAAYRAASGQ